jgi:hypothetical protein
MLLAYGKRAIMLGLIGLSLSACKPADSPPDLIKTQRQALDKAKALEGQMQQQAEDRMKAAEEEKK